ncbi:MAG: DUF2520 domain-containing protein, partial [Chloroflexi bacterium]|nr:DUF2520 domain-containing protein [Chloroflexota bacterium]
MSSRLGFIGAGTVGTALATKLAQVGYPVIAVSSRSLESAQRLAQTIPGCLAFEDAQQVADNSDIVFITTPDDFIEQVAGRVKWRAEQSVVHCSGALSLDVLEPVERQEAMAGSFHPLQTFAGPAQALDNLPGSTFGLEATEPLLMTLKRMAEALGGRWVVLRAQEKVLYHAAAVIVSNYTVTLMKMAAELWSDFQPERSMAVASLLPLLRGTVCNIESLGLPQALTGPIARGDVATVRKHVDVLGERAPGVLSADRELGLQT